MLEHSPLLLHAWTQKANPDGGRAWIRPITDAVGQPLGFVRFDGAPKTPWGSWLGKIRLDVFETDDAAHLMTLTRSWGVLGSWDVEDAEARQVGNLYTKTIVTSVNVPLGYLDCATGGQGRILGLQGGVLARFVRKDPGVLEVTFTPEPSVNPFVRMLVLGSILTVEPRPR